MGKGGFAASPQGKSIQPLRFAMRERVPVAEKSAIMGA